MLFNYNEVKTWAGSVLARSGVQQEDAAQAGGLLVRSEARGYASHSLTLFAAYVERLEKGLMNPRPNMTHRAFPGGIVLDVDGGMGQVAGPRAVELGVRALETQASVLVTLRNCGHLGALGVHALLAAEAGVLCVLGQAGPSCVGMEGFEGPGIGTNPLGFGCPLPGQPPIVFDTSSSIVARGKILMAMREGKPLPEGWAIDRQGRPTIDAEAAMLGSILPAGGHKGMGIAMMVHVLSGVLAGTADTLEQFGKPPLLTGATGHQSAFFWFIRQNAFISAEDFAEQMIGWASHYTSRSSEARLPGTRGAALEARCEAQGLALEGPLLTGLRALGERVGVPLPTPLAAA